MALTPAKQDPLPLAVVRIIVKLLVGDPSLDYRPGCEGMQRYSNEVRQYATVSLTWQRAVEEFTFHGLILTSQDLLNGISAKILSFYGRLKHVKSVRFLFLLDGSEVPLKKEIKELFSSEETSGRDWGLDWTRLMRFEKHRTLPDSTLQNGEEVLTSEASLGEAFTMALRCLCGLLAKTPKGDHPYISLSIGIQPCTHWEATRSCNNFERMTLRNDPVPCTYLELCRDASALPELPTVANFTALFRSHSVVIKPKSLCELASRMICCTSVCIETGDYEKHNDALRAQLRNEFATGLEQIPRSVTDMRLIYTPVDYFPTLLDSDPWGRRDSFSSALFAFRQREQLRALVITAVVSPSIFGSIGEPKHPIGLDIARRLIPQDGGELSPRLATLRLVFPEGERSRREFYHFLRMTYAAAQAMKREPSSTLFDLWFANLMRLKYDNRELSQEHICYGYGMLCSGNRHDDQALAKAFREVWRSANDGQLSEQALKHVHIVTSKLENIEAGRERYWF